MSLGRPSALLTVDGRQLNAAEAALVSLKIDLAMGGQHDAALLQLWPNSKFADASAGAKLAVALGDKSAETDVLTGEIGAIRCTPHGLAIEAVSATIALSRTFKSQSYLNQSVADTVNDLAGAIAIDRVTAPMRLAAYHADNRRSVWAHLQMLARLSGSDLACAADGSLRFVPAGAPALPTKLRYGVDLLDWDVARASAGLPAAVGAHGAGSEAGAAKWHWLRRGSGDGGATRVVGAIATKDAAELASRALKGRAGRAAVRGFVLIVGNASIRPGDSVQLADLSGADPGPLRVVAVRHSLDSASGFLTRLTVAAAGAGGLAP